MDLPDQPKSMQLSIHVHAHKKNICFCKQNGTGAGFPYTYKQKKQELLQAEWDRSRLPVVIIGAYQHTSCAYHTRVHKLFSAPTIALYDSHTHTRAPACMLATRRRTVAHRDKEVPVGGVHVYRVSFLLVGFAFPHLRQQNTNNRNN